MTPPLAGKDGDKVDLIDEFTGKATTLGTHRFSDGRRAPYKPLVLLIAIGRAANGCERETPYPEVSSLLRDLMLRYGGEGAGLEAHIPFWHLKNDGVWEVLDSKNIPHAEGHSRPGPAVFSERPIVGALMEKYWSLFRSNIGLARQAAEAIIDEYFEPDAKQNIMHEIGLIDPKVSIAPLAQPSKTTSGPAVAHESETGDPTMSVKLVDDARAILSMRESDFDAYSAYGEVVDNSIQAEATFCKIHFDLDDTKKARGYRRINAIAFGDDGCGMDQETLHRCLQLGFSTRYNDRSGIGRFGVGMTLAAINQCQRVEIYSKQAGSQWLRTAIDLEEVENTGVAAIPIPATCALPDAYTDLVGETSGTLVVWSKYDRQPESADKMIEEAEVWFGRTYRRFIWKDFKIEVNNKEINAIDPLYYNWAKTKFPGDTPARLFDEMKIDWPVPFGVSQESTVSIRMSLVDEKLRPHQGTGGTKEARERYIDRNQGVSIMRNDREVFYGPIPYWPGDSKWFSETDRWWGCEISFDAVLDRAFTVKNIKRGAVPNRQLKKAIYDKIKPTRETCLDEVRKIWNETNEKKMRETESKSGPQTKHAAAEMIAAKNPGQRSVREKKDTAEVIDSILPGLSEEEKALWTAKWESQPFTIHDGSWKSPSFFDVTHLGGNAIIKYNTNHPFVDSLNSIAHKLAAEAHRNEDAFRIKNYIDLMAIAFAKASSLWEEDADVEVGPFLEELQASWGRYLMSYLKAFSKEYGGADGSD